MEWIKFEDKQPPKNTYIYITRSLHAAAGIVFVDEHGAHKAEYCGACMLYCDDNAEKPFEYWKPLPSQYWGFCERHNVYYFRHFCNYKGNEHEPCEKCMQHEQALKEKRIEVIANISAWVFLGMLVVGVIYGLAMFGLWFTRKKLSIYKDVVIEGTVEAGDQLQKQKDKGVKPLPEYFFNGKIPYRNRSR